MSDINEAVAKALQEAMPGAVVTPHVEPAQPQSVVVTPPVVIPGHVADNLCQFLERVKDIQGIECIAWVEAYSLMQSLAIPFRQAKAAGAPVGPGVPFQGLGK